MSEATVSVPWVKQEQTYYCGPAVAEMILGALKVDAPPSPPSWQDQLWFDIQDETHSRRPQDADTEPSFKSQKCEQLDGQWNCWSTTPDALTRVLNLQQTRVEYAVCKHDDEAAATATLMEAVDANVPAAALVHGWQHWLVMDGYVHGTTEPAAPVGGKQLNGVYIRDSNADAEVHYVTWNAWRDDYLQFVPAGKYRDHIVVVGAEIVASVPPPAAPVPVFGKVRGRGPGVNAFQVSPEAAVEAATSAIKRLRGAMPRLQSALENAVCGTPLRVQRLDLNDSYYYLVPFHRLDEGSGETARLVVDAVTGHYSEARGINDDRTRLAPFVDPVRELAKWYGRSLPLPGVRSRIVRPAVVGLHPVLVWRPCRESSSPVKPFYQMSVGDRLVYLSADGTQWLDRLTTLPA